MRKFYYVILVTLLTSCFKEVDIDLPDPEPTLVLGGMVESGKNIEVMVTRTLPNDDTLFVLEKGANVTIETDGNLYQLEKKDEYYYTSNVIAEVNKTYSINVIVDGYPEVSAFDSVPESSDFVIEKYIETAYVDNEGCSYSSMTIDILEIPETITYYEVRLKCETDFFSTTNYYYADLTSNDIIIKDEGVVNETYGKVGLIFSNRLIDTTNQKLTFFFENYPDDELNRINEVEVQLRRVSYDYYLYKKKLYLNIENQYGDVWDGSGNPVDAYSNVTNGYGIFVGFNQTVHIKEL